MVILGSLAHSTANKMLVLVRMGSFVAKSKAYPKAVLLTTADYISAKLA